MDKTKQLQEYEKLASEYCEKLMFAESEIEFEAAEAAYKQIIEKIKQLKENS